MTSWSDLPLAGAVDRLAERRAVPGALADALADDATRVLLVHRGRVAASPGGVGGTGLELLSAAQVRGVADAPDVQGVLRWILLGALPDEAADRAGASVLALVLPDDADALPPGLEGIAAGDDWARLARGHAWSSLRDLMTSLDAAAASLAAAAVALAAWHAVHPRCARCGEPTVVTQAGWVRRCETQGVDHFPRTDPAVIMAVVDAQDRLLLGHNSAWPAGRFSTLAGYVEPGESIEQAVRREVREEAGLAVGAVEYRASQPWPFPASLMLGFRARATTTAVACDGDEVDEARWFTRDGLRAAVAAGEVVPPGRSSIARALIEEWLGEALGDA